MMTRRLRSVLTVGLFATIAWARETFAFGFQSTSGSPLTIDSVVNNLADIVPNFTQLVTAISYVMGMSFMLKGIFALKKFGEQRTQMSSEASVMPALLALFVGAALAYLPSAIDATTASLFTTPNPYAYVTTTTDTWDNLVRACIGVIQLIGAVSFIRGLVMLSLLGHHAGHQQGTLSKAITHIIAGVLCIDLWDFLSMLANTFGYSVSTS